MTAATRTTKRASRLRIKLLPYQQAWVDDPARFKIACKARQIGFTFAATYRVVRKRIDIPGLTLWLSASERQALEAVEHVRRHIKAANAVADYEEDFIEGSLLKQRAVRLANGSRIVALPANPDTVRGFAGDVVLDEFAFHRDAEAIWRAAFATATRGFQLEIISTPNGARGKYYDLAKAAGLVDYQPPEKSTSLARRGGLGMTEWGSARDASWEGQGFSPAERDVARSATTEGAWGNPAWVSPAHEAQGTRNEARFLWIPYWIDLTTARQQGFVVDVESLRAAIGDEDAWQQEYCCRFLSSAAHFLPPELVVAAEHSAATATFLPPAAGLSRAESRDAAGLGEVGRVSPSGLTLGMPREALPGKGPGENLFGFPQRGGDSYLGVDIGRRRDLTVLWLIEAEPGPAPVYWTRGLVALDRQPFRAQRQAIDELLAQRCTDELQLRGETLLQKGSPRTPSQDSYGNASDPTRGSDAFRQKVLGERESPFAKGLSRSWSYAVRRCAIDSTGLGVMLAEELQAQWGARVEPVQFTQAVKEDLAVRVKRLLEDGRVRIPCDPVIRAALGSVKRYVTATGAVRFDAERTERAGHADHFWALALALAAAEEPGISLDYVSTSRLRPFAQAAAF